MRELTELQLRCEHTLGYRTESGARVCQTCAVPWEFVERLQEESRAVTQQQGRRKGDDWYAGTYQWNTRYLAYCAATGGLSPEETLARDEQDYPGGKMCGFMLWLGQQWLHWRETAKYVGPLFAEQHAAFDAWLANPVPPPIDCLLCYRSSLDLRVMVQHLAETGHGYQERSYKPEPMEDGT